MEETLTEIEGEVLTVVAGNANLTLNLLFGSFQLGVGEWFLHHPVQFFAHQSQAALDVVFIATEVDAPGSRISVGHHRAFHGIDQSVVLSQGEIEFSVHARSAEDIVEQIERHSSVVVHIVGSCSYHHMRLMGILLHHNRLPGNLFPHRWIIFRELFCSKLARIIICECPPDKLHQLLEVNIPVGEEYRIVGAIELAGESQRILSSEGANLLGSAQDIMS